jgi:hypothetical protein
LFFVVAEKGLWDAGIMCSTIETIARLIIRLFSKD